MRSRECSKENRMDDLHSGLHGRPEAVIFEPRYEIGKIFSHVTTISILHWVPSTTSERVSGRGLLVDG